MKTSVDCDLVADQALLYVEQSMSREDSAQIQAHLQDCAACRDAVQRFSAVQDLLESATDEKENTETLIPAGAADTWFSRLGGAPWWGVSLALHALTILLAGLISVSLELPKADDAVVMVTELQPRTQLKSEPEKQKILENSALKTRQETPPTDPTSKEMSDVLVPPEILAQAEMGDHFETINPERPDTQSAFGNSEAQMFHSMQGSDEPEGGGGQGGMAGLEDVIGIGIGGSASAGSGGGFGGGNGIGVGTGAGKGSFGLRTGGGRKLMVKKHGGSPATENAVDKALDWLARHQEPDGHWNPKKYGGGQHNGTSEVGATGLALLAFLGAGHTEKVGKYKENVQKAVQWFIANQVETGQYRCKTDPGSSRMYGHGTATMAMAEAAAMARIPETIKSAQKGVDFVSEAQIKTDAEGYEREGWDYSPQGMVTDVSVSSWMVLGLKSAKVAGLGVDFRCFEGAMRWLNAAQGPDPYNVGIWYRGTLAEIKPQQEANTIKKNGPNAAAKEHSILAAAALMRMYMGTSRDDPRITTTVEHLQKKLPAWILPPQDGNSHKKVCFYHWYYGTLAMFQHGGPPWKQWNEALKNALLPSQVKGGDDDGSWDPYVSVAGEWGGRVYTTAMGALCLEVYYRYQKLNP